MNSQARIAYLLEYTRVLNTEIQALEKIRNFDRTFTSKIRIQEIKKKRLMYLDELTVLQKVDSTLELT